MVRFIYENGESRMVSQKPITIDLARKIHRHKKEVENCAKDMHSMHKVRKEINTGYFSFLSRPIPYEVSMDVVASQAKFLEDNHARLLDQIESLSDCKNDQDKDKCPNYETDNDEEFAVFLIPSQLIRDILKDINKDESEKNEEKVSESEDQDMQAPPDYVDVFLTRVDERQKMNAIRALKSSCLNLSLKECIEAVNTLAPGISGVCKGSVLLAQKVPLDDADSAFDHITGWDCGAIIQIRKHEEESETDTNIEVS